MRGDDPRSAAIVYLDVDEEITTAAARIRNERASAVALVVQPGSRLATSRMNFRLLAREASQRNRGLSIVALDASTRAIAESAGLAVYATIPEFEAAQAAGDAALAAGHGAGTEGPATRTAADTTAAARRATPSAPDAKRLGAARSEAGAPGGPAARSPSDRPTDIPPAPASGFRARSGAASMATAASVSTRKPRRGRSRWLLVGVLAILVVALGASGAILLPSATIVITPRAVAIGPKAVVIRANPDASASDPTAGVVPALRLQHDFTATADFQATGKRVVQAKANGTLHWSNCDPARAYTIPSGSIARTANGVAFATNEALLLPVATLTGPPPNPKLTCQSRDVGATAVKAGVQGNVPAGAVTIISANQNSVVISVTNRSATAGGTHQEFATVAQADVDAAMANLTSQVRGDFKTWSANPDGLPAGANVFPATAILGAPIPTPDPTTLVNKEVKTFTLSLAASGTVVAVDPAAVRSVAAGQIADAVPTGQTLLAGSTQVSQVKATADGEIIDFNLTVRGLAVPILDPAQLRASVLGRPLDEARLILSKFGGVAISTWPGFTGSIPSLDGRVTLTVASVPLPSGAASPPGAASPAAAASPSVVAPASAGPSVGPAASHSPAVGSSGP